MQAAGPSGTAAGWALPAWPAWALCVVSLGLVAYFDLGPPVAFADDFIYAWSTAHLSVTAPLPHPMQTAQGLVQIVLGYLAGLGHADQRLLRLTELPFVLLTALCSAWLAWQLGAGRFWSAVAGLSLLATPLYLTLASSYMTDVPYVGLLLAACAGAATWISDGRYRPACVALTVLAVLQRQVGLAVPAALTVTLLLQGGRGRLGRYDLVWLVGLWLAALGAVVLPALVGLAAPAQGKFLTGLASVSPGHRLEVLEYAPALIGLCLLPILPALVAIPRPRRVDWLVGAVLIVALLGFLLWLRSRRQLAELFPGNIWTSAGFTPLLAGSKPGLISRRLWILVELGSLAAIAGLAFRWRDWALGRMSRVALFLAMTAVAHLAFILVSPGQIFDRYYLPVAAPLVPLAAVAAARAAWQPAVAGAALLLAALGVGFYAVAEQDYEAWQEARDQAARLAYAEVPPDQVQAGYEANGVYVLAPEIDSGRVRATSPELESRLINGSANARIALQFAGPDDPRPGVSYRSVAPARIVLTRAAEP
jgi:hypothetical protein